MLRLRTLLEHPHGLDVLVALQVANITLFCIAARQADHALDKSGLGNVRLWEQWNVVSGSAFVSLVALWLVSWLFMHMSSRPVVGLFWLLVGVPAVFLAMFALCVMA